MRRSRDEVVGFLKNCGLEVSGSLAEEAPRFRVGPKQTCTIFTDDGANGVTARQALWGLIPPGAKERPPYLLTNARSDKLATGWPWRQIVRRGRALVVADGFYEPEKPSRSKERVPWSYYSMRDESLFAFAGLWSSAADPASGAPLNSFAIVITDANDTVRRRRHDRMPAILSAASASRWLFDEEPPEDLLLPFPAEVMQGWRVSDTAKNFRRPDHPEMILPVTEAPRVP